MVKVVGIAETDRWFMMDSIEFQRNNYFPPIDDAMIFAENSAEQDHLDHWAVKRFKGQRPLVFAYFEIEKNTQEMFATLYLILNVVIAALALVITFMMGMLMNIYQSQRLIEFGLLQALGYTKKQLLRRVLLGVYFGGLCRLDRWYWPDLLPSEARKPSSNGAEGVLPRRFRPPGIRLHDSNPDGDPDSCGCYGCAPVP